LNFEENLFSQYVTDYIYYLKINSDGFMLNLPVERVFKVSSNNQPAYWDSTCFGTAFPWSQTSTEIALHVHCSLPRDFLGRSISDSLKSALVKIYYTPHICRILQDLPPHHNIFLSYDFPQNF